MNSQAARFFLYEKWFKSWKKAEKKGKIKRKKLQKIFCLDASTCRDEMPLIKVAYFMLNFLNLKSFLSNLFFVVASSLSTLWRKLLNFENCSLSSLQKSEFVKLIILFFHYFRCQNWDRWHKMSGKNTHIYVYFLTACWGWMLLQKKGTM